MTSLTPERRNPTERFENIRQLMVYLPKDISIYARKELIPNELAENLQTFNPKNGKVTTERDTREIWYVRSSSDENLPKRFLQQGVIVLNGFEGLENKLKQKMAEQSSNQITIPEDDGQVLKEAIARDQERVSYEMVQKFIDKSAKKREQVQGSEERLRLLALRYILELEGEVKDGGIVNRNMVQKLAQSRQVEMPLHIIEDTLYQVYGDKYVVEDKVAEQRIAEEEAQENVLP